MATRQPTQNITAVYAGSFDPITKGHMEIIKTAAQMFDKIIVLVAKNPTKKGFIPADNRVTLIEEAVKEAQLTNVVVDSAPNDLLTVEYARQNNAAVLIRGVRGSADIDGEMQLAEINARLNANIRTVLLPANSAYAAISSSAVRGILACHGDVTDFVPTAVSKYLDETKKAANDNQSGKKTNNARHQLAQKLNELRNEYGHRAKTIAAQNRVVQQLRERIRS